MQRGKDWVTSLQSGNMNSKFRPVRRANCCARTMIISLARDEYRWIPKEFLRPVGTIPEGGDGFAKIGKCRGYH